ncbi:MAG: VOC family protein [Candidatus Woesearchaeota archaeon]
MRETEKDHADDVSTTGLHHITAVCSDGKRNVRFYTKVLGLSFVKKTVNQDDVGSYHLYYGDGTGSPGTLITFFTWDLPPARSGHPFATSVSFSVGDLDAWKSHLTEHRIAFDVLERFGDRSLRLADPDGLTIYLSEHPMPSRISSGTPPMHGVSGAGLSLADPGVSIGLLSAFGFSEVFEDGDLTRYVHPASSTFVEIAKDTTRGSLGSGSIHHVAFGVDPEDQERVREGIASRGFSPTPIIERFYFRSVYFREANGSLFEIASNGPGFFVDEEVLGSRLVLPPWLEEHRERIERGLPEL